MQEEIQSLTPDEFRGKYSGRYAAWNRVADSLIAQHALSPYQADLVRQNAAITYATGMLDFNSNRAFYAMQDTANAALKIKCGDDYYDFLRDIPVDDCRIVAQYEFGSFINRFEFMPVISSSLSWRSRQSVG